MLKYILSNIAQSNIPRAVISIALGVFFWMYSFIHTDQYSPYLLNCAISIGNAVLLALLFSRLGLTNLPSLFVVSTYWFVHSLLPMYHACWKGQILISSLLLAFFVLSRSHHSYREMIEEGFLSTFVLAVSSLIVPYSLIGIPLVWLYMLLRHVISVRAILASLIAVLLVLLYTFILDYLGWISLPWEKEILSTNVWYPWLAIIEVIGVGLLCYFPIRKASFLTGVLYIIGIGVCCALGVCYWVWFR